MYECPSAMTVVIDSSLTSSGPLFCLTKEGLIDRFEPGLPTGPAPDRVTRGVGVSCKRAASLSSTLGDRVKVPCTLTLGSNKSATSSVLVLSLNGSGDSIHVAELPLTVGRAEEEAAGGAGGAVVSGVSTGGSCGVSSTILSSSELVMTCFFFFCCGWLAGATFSSDVSRSVRSSVVKPGMIDSALPWEPKHLLFVVASSPSPSYRAMEFERCDRDRVLLVCGASESLSP